MSIKITFFIKDTESEFASEVCFVFRSWNPFQVANLKAELAKEGKASGFAMLDSNGRLPHNFLDAGYGDSCMRDVYVRVQTTNNQ